MPSFHSLYSLTVTLIVSACFYMDMNCFGLVRIVLSWLWVDSVAADSLVWVVVDSFGWLGWFWVVSVGFGWFQMVMVGFDWFAVLVVTFLAFMRLERSLTVWYILLLKKTQHSKRFVKFLNWIFVFILLKLKQKIASKHFIHQFI